jgi:hypothetical protein
LRHAASSIHRSKRLSVEYVIHAPGRARVVNVCDEPAVGAVHRRECRRVAALEHGRCGSVAHVRVEVATQHNRHECGRANQHVDFLDAPPRLLQPQRRVRFCVRVCKVRRRHQ